MECPICGTELEYYDYFGHIAAHQDGKICGEIYKCPLGSNCDGSCESDLFYVSGSYYIYCDSDELHEGYPC